MAKAGSDPAVGLLCKRWAAAAAVVLLAGIALHGMVRGYGPFSGVTRAAVGRARRVADRVLEKRYGVRTADFVYLEDLGLRPEHRVWHDPSDWICLRRALGRLGIGRHDVFVDYGSGLGRAVLVPASLPFQRVIGVELAEVMTARSRENVWRNRHRLKAHEVHLVVVDALEWEVPADLTVAYLFCPFTEEVFDRVMQKLFDSVDEHPRPLRIVYNYPLEHSRLIRSGRVRVLDVVSSQWLARSRVGSHVIVTYLVLPKDEALRQEYIERFPQRLKGAEVWLGEHEPGYSLEKPHRLGRVVLKRERRAEARSVECEQVAAHPPTAVESGKSSPDCTRVQEIEVARV